MSQRKCSKNVIIIIVVVLLAGSTAYYFVNQKIKPTNLKPSLFQTENLNSNLVTRNDWLISFKKQSNWSITNNVPMQMELKQVSGKWKDDIITIQYVAGDKITDKDAKFGDITYWYDQSKGEWMRTGRTDERTGATEPAVVKAIPQFYVAGNMPVFLGTGRWLTYIIPLSYTSFLKFNIIGSGYTQPLTDLVKTISKL